MEMFWAGRFLRPGTSAACYGLGVADDLQSLTVCSRTQTLIPEPFVFIANLPLCEDL